MRIINCTANAYGLVLGNQRESIRLSFADIEYLEVCNKTVSFHLINGLIREVTAALSVFEEKLLCRPEFLKTHRSYIVNLNYIQSIDANFAVTKRGDNVPVSRQRRNQIQNAYMKFLQRHETINFMPAATASSEQRESKKDSWRILLIDDDAAERVFWSDILCRHHCRVQMAANGKEALLMTAKEAFDCVLLDVMIPDEDGFSICEKIRRQRDIPIIFLSCLTESERQVEGFAAGGIDYITKDTPEELFWAKVETRIKLAAEDCTQFQDGPLLLDLTQRKVMMDGKELSFTSAEFDILWCLTEHIGHVFTMEEIHGIIRGDTPWDGSQTVQAHMSRLRRKLEKAWGDHCFIEAVWGQGYRFVPVKQASVMEEGSE